MSNQDLENKTQNETEEQSNGSVNWTFVAIAVTSFLFVVYLIYSQYKANHG